MSDDDISVDSLLTPRPLEDDDADTPSPPPRGTLSEQMYDAGNRSLKALAILSLGLVNDDGAPTFDLAVLPWSAALRPTTLKMTAKELRSEILRRCVAAENVLSTPRPNQWTVARATEWLKNNPIVAVDEVAFIRATIAHRIAVAERAIAAQPDVSSDPPAASKGSKWIGKLPHLRLIHAIIDDVNIKSAYICRHHVPSGRMAVENRRTAEAVASNVWHMVSEKWNNKSFAPTTSIKDTHSDFALPISIPFDCICNLMPATPEKVEEKWNAMNLALKRQIQNWERSGQGDGGYTTDDDAADDDDLDDDNVNNFGSLKGRPY